MSDKVYTYYDLMAARDIAGDTMTRIGAENEKVVVVNAEGRRQGFG